MDIDKQDRPLPPPPSAEVRHERRTAPSGVVTLNDISFSGNTRENFAGRNNVFLHPNVGKLIATISNPKSSVDDVVGGLRALYGRRQEPLFAPTFAELRTALEAGVSARTQTPEDATRSLEERFSTNEKKTLLAVALRVRDDQEFERRLKAETWWKNKIAEPK